MGWPWASSSLLAQAEPKSELSEKEAPSHICSLLKPKSMGARLGTHCLRLNGRALSQGFLPVLLLGSPPPLIVPTPYKAGSAVLSPKPASSAPLTGPVKAALTSSQVPRDEAEEEADDVSQVLLAAMVAFLKPQSSPPGWAWGLPTPRHPWAGPHPGGPSSCPQLGLISHSAGYLQPAPSFLCLPLPNLTLRAFLLEFSLSPLWPVSQP